MKHLLAILLVMCTAFSSAQYDMEENKKDKKKKEKTVSLFELKKRIFVGGEFSLRFGWQTYLYVAPVVGYDFVPEKFSGGLSTMYQLYRERNPANGSVFSTHAYGGGVFLRYRPIKFLMLQTEFNVYNTNRIQGGLIYPDRVTVPAALLGVGYTGNIGGRAYYHLMVMYDFINDPSMPLPRFFPQPFYIKYGISIYLGS